jgi:hypothetical protein
MTASKVYMCVGVDYEWEVFRYNLGVVHTLEEALAFPAFSNDRNLTKFDAFSIEEWVTGSLTCSKRWERDVASDQWVEK